MTDSQDLFAVRQQKLDALRTDGTDPFLAN